MSFQYVEEHDSTYSPLISATSSMSSSPAYTPINVPLGIFLVPANTPEIVIVKQKKTEKN
jgi:hypothetical protein